MRNKSKILLMLPGAIEAMQNRDNKTISVLSEEQTKINRETFVRRIGNIAIVGINGPLVNHLSFAEWFAGYNSYEWIMEDLKNAINDETVSKIVLDFDSPGGSSSEMFEMAAYIRKMGANKPIYAWVGSMAASAAYGLASACKKIYANPAAEIGSVGTMIIASHQEEPDQSGVKYIQIVATDSPMKNADPTTPEGMQSYLDRINGINGQFIEMLAANRGVTVDYVKSNFGKGAVFSGREALDRRMIDGTFATFDDLMSFLTKDQGGNTMKDDGIKAEDLDLVVSEDTTAPAEPESAPVAAEQEPVTEPVETPAESLEDTPAVDNADEIRANAVADERARVAALAELATAANANASVLAQAIADGLTPDDFSKNLVASRETQDVINTRATVEQSREESHTKKVDSWNGRL